MNRGIWVLLFVPICFALGVVGAFVGFCMEIQWPLSEENFSAVLRYGILYGAVGAVVVGILLLTVDSKYVGWTAVVACLVFFLVSSCCMWFEVVKGLG
jgi:hypothetical protein